VWELEVPVAGVEPEQFGIIVQGEQVTVTVGGRSSQSGRGHVGQVTADRFEERRQSFRLPPGAKVAAVEARIEGHSLWLRIRLQK
jgi:HSP20 family molecular chaperone IbpA